MPSDLSGYVCVVTGASRGVGQGIAIGLGKAGATVYLTGRTLSAENGKGGVSLRDTAHIINASGGVSFEKQYSYLCFAVILTFST